MNLSSTSVLLRLSHTKAGRAIAPTLSRAVDGDRTPPAAIRATSATPRRAAYGITVRTTYDCAGQAARGITAGISSASLSTAAHQSALRMSRACSEALISVLLHTSVCCSKALAAASLLSRVFRRICNCHTGFTAVASALPRPQQTPSPPSLCRSGPLHQALPVLRPQPVGRSAHQPARRPADRRLWSRRRHAARRTRRTRRTGAGWRTCARSTATLQSLVCCAVSPTLTVTLILT